jgi:hypothetical protein
MKGYYYFHGAFINNRSGAQDFTEDEANKIISNSTFFLEKVPKLEESKVVVYLVREKCKNKEQPIVFASIDEQLRDLWYKSNSPILLSKFESVDEIANLADFLINTKKSMSGIEKLLLELPVDEHSGKKSIFLVATYGSDGKDAENIIFASQSEIERDDFFKESKYKRYYSKIERVVNLAKEKEKFINNLNGLEKLVLNIGQD